MTIQDILEETDFTYDEALAALEELESRDPSAYEDDWDGMTAAEYRRETRMMRRTYGDDWESLL